MIGTKDVVPVLGQVVGVEAVRIAVLKCFVRQYRYVLLLILCAQSAMSEVVCIICIVFSYINNHCSTSLAKL